MKKLVLHFLFLIIPIYVAMGQGITVGAKAGVNLASLALPESQVPGMRLGANAGVFVGVSASALFSLQPEFNYTIIGARIVEENNAKVDKAYILRYYEVPLLAKVTTGDIFKIYINAGPCFSFLHKAQLKEQTKLPGQSNTTITDVTKSFNDNNLGLTFGGGVMFGKVMVDIRYGLGLKDIYYSPDSTIKTRSLNISAGYTFSF